MQENNPESYDKMQLDEYKAMETRLYGEVFKLCRRHSNKLSIISIVGILDIVKQEIIDLEKQNFQFMQGDAPD